MSISVVSSRSTRLSSILKTPGARTKLNNRVNFKLPHNLKSILVDFESGVNSKSYDELLSTLSNSIIKDKELIQLLSDIKQCISMLGSSFKGLVEAMLSIEWTNRCPEAITAYKTFLEDLTIVHIYHCKDVMDKLVCKFVVKDDKENEWENRKPSDQDNEKFGHILDVIFKLLEMIPMSHDVLIQSLTLNFPYHKKSAHTHEVYLYALFQILRYSENSECVSQMRPDFRLQILSLIVNKLIILDVNAPRVKIENYHKEELSDDEDENVENNGIFDIDMVSNNDKTKPPEHLIAHTLDVCMEMLMGYIYEICHQDNEIQILNLTKLYPELLEIFDKIILPTYASHHVQFIMFYICSFRVSVVEKFVNWLWSKVSNPNAPPVIRQSAVAYIASLLARGDFVPLSLIKRILFEMTKWTHSYIEAQDSLECANSDVRVHTVFYSICQALFYIVGFRHKDLVATRQNLVFLENLNFAKIVGCQLNPLRVCLPAVVQHFAAVTRAYQLAYCFSVMERNARCYLPIVESSNRFITWLDTFFPFDPYLLQQSSHRISKIYLHYQGNINPETNINNEEENDDDDDHFMDTSEHHDNHNFLDKFTYGTSPGFIHS